MSRTAWSFPVIAPLSIFFGRKQELRLLTFCHRKREAKSQSCLASAGSLSLFLLPNFSSGECHHDDKKYRDKEYT